LWCVLVPFIAPYVPQKLTATKISFHSPRTSGGAGRTTGQTAETPGRTFRFICFVTGRARCSRVASRFPVISSSPQTMYGVRTLRHLRPIHFWRFCPLFQVLMSRSSALELVPHHRCSSVAALARSVARSFRASSDGPQARWTPHSTRLVRSTGTDKAVVVVCPLSLLTNATVVVQRRDR
jgi:hypothetical protein